MLASGVSSRGRTGIEDDLPQHTLSPGILADGGGPNLRGLTAGKSARATLRPRAAQLHSLPTPPLPRHPTAVAGTVNRMGHRHFSRPDRCPTDGGKRGFLRGKRRAAGSGAGSQPCHYG